MLRSALEDSHTESLIKLVMAGSHGFLSQVRQRTSPLWGVLETYSLCILSRGECRQLVTQPLEGLLKRGAVDEVLHQSGGHPFLAQYLMNHLCTSEPSRATAGHVRRIAALTATPSHAHVRQIFRAWMRDIGEAAPSIYRLLANSEQPLTLAQVRAQFGLELSDPDDTLDALIYHGLICFDETGQQYEITGEMFRTWFRSEARFEHNRTEDQFVNYDTAYVREKLRRLSESQLIAFCQDNFSVVALGWSEGQSLAQKASQLIDYCLRKNSEWDRLIKLLQYEVV